MGKSTRRKKPDVVANLRDVPFEAPQKLGPNQVLVVERFAEGTAGTKRRVKNIGEHPLTLAYARGQLESKYPDDVPKQERITADERYDAGEEYRKAFEQMNRSGKDSTDMTGSGGAGSGTPWTQVQARAALTIGKIESRMHHRDALVIRKFCGEGCSMVDALRAARIDVHPSSVSYRVREALDDLVAATTGRRFIPTPQDVA
jgi:hypothetical protein